MTLQTARETLYKLGDPSKAAHLSRFFKTAPGTYGAHDQFLGILVPHVRAIAKAYKDLPFEDCADFLQSSFNEERLLALLILRFQFEKAPPEQQQAIVDFYLRHSEAINNWNLVDLSAPYILGKYAVQSANSQLLLNLAPAANMWQRRIAIVSSYAFIRRKRYDITLSLAEIFLTDTQELMHKATGWMLREVGKREREALCAFLDQHAAHMPRKMLSYALEHFDKETRQFYRTKMS
ncbi:DNA alkylation repair protein [Alphaproteobacteria bacterium]|nr:DNA alkylation repair protein [Alphaproteobacteria bacterium]GHS98635.1 DNA alkylation repair protein [Alphaproteobacteria bacterium]